MSHPTLAAAAANAPPVQQAASPWPTFWIACIAVFLVSLDSTVLFAAFGALERAFPQASAADLSWVLNAYTVVYAAVLIPAGGLADNYGRKRFFLLGVALFLAASAACGSAGSVELLIAARVLQAVGAALLTPASLSIVLDAFPKEKRAIAVSLWGAVGGLAAALGPSLGTFVVAKMGWPWAFYVNLPLGAISLWRGARYLKEVKTSGKAASPSVPLHDVEREDSSAGLAKGGRHVGRHGHKVDWLGMALLIVAVGAIALAITQADSPHWSRLDLAAAAVTGVIMLGAFVIWARSTRYPLVDLALFRNRTYSAVNLATLSFGMAFAMMFFAFFSYMTGIWHYSLPQAGLAITPGPLTVIPTAIITGRLAARLGHRPFLVIGSLVYALSGLWLLTVPGTEPAYLARWLPALLLSGIGVGMVLPSLAGAAVAGLPPAHYAVGSAVNQAVRQVGAVLGVALTVLFIGHAGLVRADFLPVYGSHVALALLTGLLCVVVNTRPARAPA